MLIKDVIEHLHDKLIGTEIFEKVYGLVELMTDGDGMFSPHEYVSNGKYNRINVSAFNGVAYFRKSGEITNVDVSFQSALPCQNLLGLNVPIKIVAFKNKSKLPIDCAFSDDWLAEQVIQAVSGKSGALKKKVGAQSVAINFTSYNTDSNVVWSQETNLSENKDVNSKIACISVDLLVSVAIDKNCFKNVCEYGEV